MSEIFKRINELGIVPVVKIEDAKDAVEDIRSLTSEQMNGDPKPNEDSSPDSKIPVPNHFFSSKTYCFNGIYFSFSYGDAVSYVRIVC